MAQYYDAATGLPVWLDRTQPLAQVDATLGLLRAWLRVTPRLALVDFYEYASTRPPMVYMSCRN